MKFALLPLMILVLAPAAHAVQHRPVTQVSSPPANPDQKIAGEEDDDDDQEADAQTANPKMIYGNVTLTSDYVLRGFSQTDHRPAIQGGFDWTHPTGFSLGVWGSSVYFPYEPANIELDYMAAYQYQFSKDLAAKAGVNRITYPGENERSSWDFPLRLSYKQAALDVDYSPAWQGEGVSWYYQASYLQPLPYGFNSDFALGYATVEGNQGESYPDARIAVSRRVCGVNVEASAILIRDQDVKGSQSASTFIISATQDF